MPRDRRRSLSGVALAALLILVSACAPEPPRPAERLVVSSATFDDLPGWTADEVGAAVPAILASCRRILAGPPDRGVGPDGVGGRVIDWKRPCDALAGVSPTDGVALRRAIETAFRPWSATTVDRADGLFTGYYEAELRGARNPDERYTVPLYRRPPDLVEVDLGHFREALRGERIAGRVEGGRLRPYPDRGAIDDGALASRGLELVWVDDPVDAFFLQIQGSGRVVMADGSVARVGYDGQNGHPYVAVGRVLVQRGIMRVEQVTMQSIRAWLAANPAEAPGLLRQNPSFVFFREIAGDGPLGAQGIALTPGRSLAIDPRFLPLGAPIWLDAEDPRMADARIRRLVVAQDTGGAIRGPVRGDLFWGHGADAEEAAGRMRSRGRYWLLLPVGVSPPGA
jgi:membrane-bound lytic murein transglycosylase A